MISLMSQFTPVYKAFDYKELCRKTSTFEYNTVIDAVNKYGFEGFVQSRTSAAKDFIPKFYDENTTDIQFLSDCHANADSPIFL